jgi:hypothetical protein
MSSPVDGNGKRDDPSAYAPKSVRDSNREGSHESSSIAEDQCPQQSEQSVPEKAPASDQARSHRPFDTTFSREARLLAGLGAGALRANSLKVTRSPACLVP